MCFPKVSMDNGQCSESFTPLLAYSISFMRWSVTWNDRISWPAEGLKEVLSCDCSSTNQLDYSKILAFRNV